MSDRTTPGPNGDRIVLLEYARTHRAALVLKPNRSYGDEGVEVGATVDQATWDRLLDTALADEDRWVIQSKVVLPVQEYPVPGPDGQIHLEPFYVVIGFVPSRYGVGLVARASQQQVVNVAQHGGECGVMVSASAVG